MNFGSAKQRNNAKGEAVNISMLKKVRELYNVDYLSYQENRANQRKWVKAIRMVGDKWLLKQKGKRNEDALNNVV
jgi:hypothetical protein